jgi:hypothetical protein|tara:strand:- start:1496 stop:1705 length:210 start_codon:yes stop_codon:yes gene_type:complete
MYKYYEVHAIIDGMDGILYGSYIKNECEDEIDAEKDGWKKDGWKNIKIVSRLTEETPDIDVYGSMIFDI